MKAIQPWYHEFAANFLFNDDGLAPFFAADSRVKAGGGGQVAQFSLEGERWVVKLYYQSSNIVHPDDPEQHLPAEIDWRLEEMREFRIAVRRHPDEDSLGEQKANFHIAPRWPEMVAETKSGNLKSISVPQNFGIGINVRAKGSNISFRKYEKLLRAAAGSVRINSHYFEDPHENSNIQDAERYVRVHTNKSGPIHARDGPIARMSHLLENDREGYRKVVQNDQDEHGRNLPGYYHTVTLDPRRVQEAFPGHELPVEVKHYYAREALDRPMDDPLRHPKLGASYQVSRWDGKLGVTDEDLTQLERELDRIVRSVLSNSGLEVADTGQYFEDAYFEPEVTERGPNPIELELTRIRQKSESIVVKHLADGLSPVQWETLETAVTDGGQLSPKDVAEKNDRHINSVYRAIAGMDDMLDRAYDQLALKNDHVAELVLDAVERARKTNERAFDTVAKVAEAGERGLEAGTSAFIAWAANHGVDVDDREDARMRIRMDDLPSKVFRRRVRQAFRLWKDANRDPSQFYQAQIVMPDGRKARAAEYL